MVDSIYGQLPPNLQLCFPTISEHDNARFQSGNQATLTSTGALTHADLHFSPSHCCQLCGLICGFEFERPRLSNCRKATFSIENNIGTVLVPLLR